MTTEHSSAEKQCDHKSMPPILFDQDAASKLDSAEIRGRWPRGDGVCPDCQQRVIRYASFAHYIYGDW